MKILNCYFTIICLLFLAACGSKEMQTNRISPKESDPNEIFGYYSAPETEVIYSNSVSDSFKIFTSVPGDYTKDTTTLPLLLVLDANAYFESIVAELKFATLTQGLPKCIVVGVGYKNFWAMDSLRNRDYTYPVAPPEDEFSISGGGDRFKRFLDAELLPKLFQQYNVKRDQVVLIGHSLGGYFVLYHLLASSEEQKYRITNYISVSPSLSYGKEYLFDAEENLSQLKKPLPVKLYISNGSLETGKGEEDLFTKLKTQMESRQYLQAQLKFIEFGNFDHMDSAMPGFMKGLVFAFEK